MIGFFIKKSFFDGWDNLIPLILFNIVYVIFLALGYLAVTLFTAYAVWGILAMLLWLFALQAYNGTVSFFVFEFTNYKRPEIKELKRCFQESLPYILLLTLASVVLLVIVFIVIPFYAMSAGILSAISLALMFWLSIFGWTAIMFYLPIARQLKDKPIKTLKKTFMVFIDNLGFSLFLLFYTLINTVISIATAFLIPGFASILMTHQIAFKLRMYKYDYLEENPEASRKDIPWDALLIDERDKVGHRTLKGMIFPWKE